MKLPIKLNIPKSFFVEEVKYDYTITQNMKKIWAVQLDLLNEFIRVCEEYQLRWFMGYGSLLGVVRHKGYIPWDNDIDVMMPRDDFNMLLEIGEKEFQHPYFFQNPKTDNGRFFFFFSRLSNSMTTGASPEHWASRMNCGMYLDIFPLDNVPDNKWAFKCHMTRLNNIQYMSRFSGTFYRDEKKGFVPKLKMLVHYIHYRIIGSPNAAELFERFNRLSSRYDGKTKTMCCVVFGFRKDSTWKSNEWKEDEWADFEMLKVRIPKFYHEVLTESYDNYMQVPDDKTTHDYIIFDSETPYYEYFPTHGYAYK